MSCFSTQRMAIGIHTLKPSEPLDFKKSLSECCILYLKRHCQKQWNLFCWKLKLTQRPVSIMQLKNALKLIRYWIWCWNKYCANMINCKSVGMGTTNVWLRIPKNKLILKYMNTYDINQNWLYSSTVSQF